MVSKHFADDLAENFLPALLLLVVIVIAIISANEGRLALESGRNSSERGGLCQLYQILDSYTQKRVILTAYRVKIIIVIVVVVVMMVGWFQSVIVGCL